MGGFAWVTLATNDSYALGALVLAHSLKRVNTAHQLAVMITPGVSEAMKTQLSAVFNVVKQVDVLDSRDQENLTLLARPELGITFTKLHCWKLTQFDKCVFLDADTIVLQNSDELFEREEFSAAPDVGWPDCFNSGVFVFKPSEKTFKDLIDFALVHGTFDGGDQGLLNLFFSDWATKDIQKHLPFVYNVVSSTVYTYLPAFKQFKDKLKIIHFIGSSKPWLQPYNTETGVAQVSGDAHTQSSFIQLWWDIFCAYVHPTLTLNMAGLAAALSTIKLGTPLSREQTALQEHLRRQGWEEGNIDYMGRDSFDNIWKKITETLASGQEAEAKPESSVTPSAPPASEKAPDHEPAPVDITLTSQEEGKQPEITNDLTSTIPPKDSVVEPTSVPESTKDPTKEPLTKKTDSSISSSQTPVEEKASIKPEATQKIDALPAEPSLPITTSESTLTSSTTQSETSISAPITQTSEISVIKEQIVSTPTEEKPTTVEKVTEVPETEAAAILTPPQSPEQTKPSSQLKTTPLTPSTPTITSPTPPTSPPITQEPLSLTSVLKVQQDSPPTPPVPQTAAQPPLTESSSIPIDEPPVPPKRKGGKGAATPSSGSSPTQGEAASKHHHSSKGGKVGKGKK